MSSLYLLRFQKEAASWHKPRRGDTLLKQDAVFYHSSQEELRLWAEEVTASKGGRLTWTKTPQGLRGSVPWPSPRGCGGVFLIERASALPRKKVHRP